MFLVHDVRLLYTNHRYTYVWKGIRGGMFRSKRGFDESQPEDKRFVFYKLAVGVKIMVDYFEFIITDVDDKTLRFMINNPTEVITDGSRRTLKTILIVTVPAQQFGDLEEQNVGNDQRPVREPGRFPNEKLPGPGVGGPRGV